MTCATPLLLQVATKVEKGEELLLLGVQRREGTDRSGMTLTLFFGVDHQGFADAAQEFKHPEQA